MADEVLLDTNVILRFVLGDDETRHEQAKRLFHQAIEGEVRLLLPTLVLAQVVWTLESFYQASRRYITNVLDALLATPGVISLEPRHSALRRNLQRLQCRDCRRVSGRARGGD